MPDVLTPAEYRALTQGHGNKSKKPGSGGHRRTKEVAAPNPPPKPPASLTAQQNAVIGSPACQIWKGASGQGSVVRFYNLPAADFTALLDFAASRGIHPVNR